LDLHIHSRFSRACSRDLALENIDRACRTKGIDIIATGDFTHPAWFREIKDKLAPSRKHAPGKVERRKAESHLEENVLYLLESAEDDKVKFILSTEISLIYKQGEKTRRIHIVLHAPSIKAAGELNGYLEKGGYNLKSDGRPILGMSAEKLVEICLSIHPKFLIYPAHIWTPWFSVFGSKSGFDTMEECFGAQTENIHAIETGLSSDPEMNWRLSALDKYAIISNSDAHSPANIGREANIMDLDSATYDEIYHAVKSKDPDKLKGTIEFYPEEGMYHLDGHRLCKVRMEPRETRKRQGICPVCRKPLVIGVLNRVEELADREQGFRPADAAPYLKLVELDKIIADSLGIKSRTSRRVQSEYHKLIEAGGGEMRILMDLSIDELERITSPGIAEGVKRVREGRLRIEPGFDGQYGTIKIFNEEEREANRQGKLF